MTNARQCPPHGWRTNILLATLCLAMSGSAYAADSAGPKTLADALLARTPHPGGVVVLLHAGDGRLAVALADRSTPPLVYAAEFCEEPYQAARALAAQAGLLGRTLYVQKAAPASQPLASCYADLVAYTDLTDADLQPPLLAEILRLLVPLNGRAVVGRAKSVAGAGALTPAKLEAWAKAGGAATDVKIVNDASGLWAVFGRPALEGMDDWTHWFHGPDNNPLSSDQAFIAPTQVAWLAKPYHLPRSLGGRVAACGRIYLATGAGSYQGDWAESFVWELLAYNAYNGRLLWKQPWTENQRTQASVLIADGDTLLAAAGPEVKRLDGATGKELGRLAPAGAAAGQIKWMGLADNVLTVLVGPPDPPDHGYFRDLKLLKDQHLEKKIGYGSILIACDPASGKIIWRHDAPQPIDGQQIGRSNGRLFYHAPGARVAALDVRDGHEVWTNTSPEVMDVLGKGPLPELSPGNAHDRPGLVCTPEAVYLGVFESKAFLALSAKDGKLLWSKPSKGSLVRNLVHGSELFLSGLVEPAEFYDALTGVANKTVRPSLGGGCGTFTGSARYLVGQVGGPVFDFDNHYNLRQVPLKTQCGLGAFVTQGQYFSSPAACFCQVSRGFSALTSARGLDYRTTPDLKQQLLTGPGDLQKITPLATEARDWTAHRGGPAHAGSTTIAAPTAAPAVLWTCTPPTPFTLPVRTPFTEETEHKITEPVTAGGLVFFGATDGRVQCLSATDGAPRWTFWTEGAVLATPTVSQGRLYVGSADGCVYALEAASGRLLWRFRPGPDGRRILIYGHLQSPWPVNSGVLVADGVAYAAAGLTLQPGSFVVALDAVTGMPRWQYQNPGGATDVEPKSPKGLMPTGYLTLAAGRLWVRSFAAGSGGWAFDPATGKPLPPVINTGGLRGREIGVLRDRYLLYGGGEVYHDQTYRAAERSGGMALLELAADGTPQLPDLCFLGATNLAPAWNNTRLVTVGSPGSASAAQGQLQCWDVDRMLAFFCDPAKRDNLAKTPDWRRDQLPRDLDDKERKAAESVRVWGPLPLEVNSLVLTPGAVLVTWGTKDPKAGNRLTTWQLGAYKLEDGSKLWEMPLPAEPLTGAMAVDRDGRILVSLRDGRVVCYAGKQ